MGKKVNSIELVDMVKFDKENLSQDAYTFLQVIQEEIDAELYDRAINSLWFLSQTLYRLKQATDIKF